MLSRAERGIVDRERAVPGLGVVLDPDAFRSELADRFPEAGIGEARRTYIRYKPGQNCLVAYRIETASGELDVYAKAHGPDASVKIGKDAGRRQLPSPLGPGRFAFEPLGIGISVFPNDSKLPALLELVAEETRTAMLGSVLPDRTSLTGTELVRLQYKPERRFVGRLSDSGAPWGVLKLYTRQGYRNARRRALAFHDGEVLRVPRLLGKWSHPGAVVTEWMPGSLLSQEMREPPFDPATVGRVGRALAELQDQEPEERLPGRRANAEVTTLYALAETMGILVPELAPRTWEITRSLAAAVERIEPVWSSVHGDFYAKQVLVDGDRVGFIDLDGAIRGPTVADPGLFLAHLHRDALRGTLPPDRLEPIRDAFLDGYGRGSDDGMPLELYVAFGLFQLIHDPFRHCEPDWEARTEAMLHRVEELLPEEARGPGRPRRTGPGDVPEGASVPVADPFGVTGDPAMPFLRDAIEPKRVVEEFGNRLFAGRPFDLLAIRVARHKHGRRCVIEYDVALDGHDEPITLVAKVRAKGLDRAGLRIVEALGEAGLRAGAPIEVPEPLGAVPEWRMWLQRKIEGVAVADLLGSEAGEAVAPRVGAAIHRLHEAGVASDKHHGMDDELRILHERIPGVAEERPEWTGRLARVLEACDRLGATHPTIRRAGIHRDFYPDHVIVDGDRLHVIDFDLYCEGDPALDAGNWCGHLIEAGLRQFGDPARLDGEIEAFEEAFLERSGEELRSAVDAYTTLTLVRHIHISTLMPKRRRFTERLLQLSEERLLSGNRGGTIE